MPINCTHENLKFIRPGCFMPKLGVHRILWECVDCRTILSFNIQPAPNKVLHADAAMPPSAEPDYGSDIVPAVGPLGGRFA